MISAIVSFFLGAIAVILAVCAIAFLVEILVARFGSRPGAEPDSGKSDVVRIAVIVPAHNEGTGIVATLEDIAAQLGPSGRIVVVADNCSDNTADVARGQGCEVVERHEPDRRGKGYALEWGVRHLAADPPDVAIIVDADCRVAKGAIAKLATLSRETGRPVQALYLMKAPGGPAINHQVAEFAWRIKNWVRPMGLHALRLPCQMMGSGMAFPWKILSSASLGNANLVEDMVLGLELAKHGNAPIFCASALVTSEFPSSQRGADTQRLRWVKGHIQAIAQWLPELLRHGLLQRNLQLLALGADMLIPPLSLFCMLAFVLLLCSGLWTLLGHSAFALAASVIALTALLLGVALAWLQCGQDVLPPASVQRLLPFLANRARVYFKLATSRTTAEWIRTDRAKP